MQGIQRVQANMDDTCLDFPDAKHRFAEVAAAAGQWDFGDAFSDHGTITQSAAAQWLEC